MFNSPRLLAHILLFPIDKFIAAKTQGSYARWVDDINFGVDTKSKAKEILRAVERFLARLELRLNGPKTQILSRQEAEEYLFVADNLKLTDYQNALMKPPIAKELIEDYAGDFLHFLAQGTAEGPLGPSLSTLYQYHVENTNSISSR